VLSSAEELELKKIASKYTSPYYQVVRAKVILMAAQGLDNNTIGQRLDLPRQIMSKWRKRFFEQSLKDCTIVLGPDDRPVFPPNVVMEVKVLACELPGERGIPLSRFSTAEIAAEVIRRGIVAQISGSTVWRWLSEDAIRPWQYRSWIFPRDPQFEQKAARVLDLYQGMWNGHPLGTDEYVISADEKTSIQARVRRHTANAPRAGTCMRVEHEYVRGGSLTYIAAWDVKRAKVFGRCEPRSGIEPF
jgi:hypothetical protein